ncbi:hypothetical protein LX32DRAFT_636336 [Colletotrichum zoysiae]|uniref:Secreted peptide n=1 Tax=Colletotrichum zoysiae TaxID=1216348 RepID=A0AAD9M330_9PEZI|nr:hypothetical protein LX32DRAFT_636336 [Colletotrichum zoysiae]
MLEIAALLFPSLVAPYFLFLAVYLPSVQSSTEPTPLEPSACCRCHAGSAFEDLLLPSELPRIVDSICIFMDRTA